MNFKAPLGYSVPALSYGTQLCEEPPDCCIPGIDYHHFYDELECPRVLMNVSVCYNYMCDTHMHIHIHTCTHT